MKRVTPSAVPTYSYEADFLKTVCVLYYLVGISFLLISFYSKTISKWSLHGKNLFRKIQKDEEENISIFYTLKKKIDNMIISKKYFAHFYIVGFLGFNDGLKGICAGTQVYVSATTALFEVHLIRRLLEQLLVVRPTPKSFMHVLSYLVGITLIKKKEKNPNGGKYGIGTSSQVMHANGRTNYHANFSPLDAQDIDALYKVPYGGLFYYVSCPHYFAEILIYFSFFLMNLDFFSQPLYGVPNTAQERRTNTCVVPEDMAKCISKVGLRENGEIKLSQELLFLLLPFYIFAGRGK
ncbi:polyprenol reductase, putative [Plasmodium ovale curtisi]|uniref:Polyprenol reductase, putative n=1 Tax=Plasmodium ovale curtisi TaxID=864141 RepID=A0A1A8WX90_PLAOA|nr:polyprenol reductase, putative [Plasmodium ovale curtisi]